MPIYEYKCECCGNYLESIQKINDAPLVDCPQCGKPGLHKLVSAPSFQLKGSGWYVTDFRDNKKEPPKTSHAADADKSTPADKPAEPSKSSEEKTKPATDTTTKTSNDERKD